MTNSHHLPCPAPSGQGAQHATGRPSFVRHQCQHSVPGRVDGDGMLQAVDVFFLIHPLAGLPALEQAVTLTTLWHDGPGLP